MPPWGSAGWSSMKQSTVQRPILAVLGGSNALDEEIAVAEAVGVCAATHQWVVLTGGGPGVMAAACRGAVSMGGMTVGLLPVASPTPSYPNPWVGIPIFTGVGSARNTFNILSASLCVALGGGAGTLSEIALALKLGKEIWCWRSWRLTPPEGRAVPPPRVFEEKEELLRALAQRLAKTPGQ